MPKATMQVVNKGQSRTYRAEGTMTYLTRGRGVMAGTAVDQVKVPSGGAVRITGVVVETPIPATAGEPMEVCTFGECIGISGQATLPINTPVKVEAEGDFISCAAADVECCGFSMSPATADGDEFLMFVLPVLKKS